MLLAIVALLKAGHAYADHEYAFTVESSGAFQYVYRGAVYTDGSKFRVSYVTDPDTVLPHNTVIVDSDQRVAINDDNRTWYLLKTGRPNRFSRSVCDFYRASANRIVSEKFDRTPATLVFRLRIATDLGGTSVLSTLRGQIDVTRDERLEYTLPFGQLISLDTGLPDLDAAVAGYLSSVGTSITSATVSLTRKLDGGNSFVQILHVGIRERRNVSSDPSRFRVPSDYQRQEPVIGH